MSVLPISPMHAAILKYHPSSGGVNIDKLKRLVDHDNPESGVEVTISTEARDLYRKMVEAETK